MGADRAPAVRLTVGSLAVALFGVALVITEGHPASLLDGAFGWGELLVLGGVFSFVLYTLGASRETGLSPLRYTALTRRSAGSRSRAPPWSWTWPAGSRGLAGRLRDAGPAILYIALIGAVVAVLAWNAATARIGPQNTALFGNLIPVTTFAIEIARGDRPGAVELLGGAITIAAVVAANVLARRQARPRWQPVPALQAER